MIIHAYVASGATTVAELDSISISESHDGASTVASFTVSTARYPAAIGLYSPVGIYIGDENGTALAFTGIVKRIDRSYPDSKATFSCNDLLVRASDYFLASPDGKPYTYTNAAIESVIQDLLVTKAGVPNFSCPVPTAFTIATGGTKLEINLQTAYDAANQLAELIAWKIWADHNGVTWLKNRKPYVMDGTSGQPGDVADIPISKTITSDDIISVNIARNERDLRNKVVVYGKNLVKTASNSLSYDPLASGGAGGFVPVLPSGFYKSVVLSSAIITDASFAQDACNYNLALLNRVIWELNLSVVGDYRYHAKSTVNVTLTYNGINLTGEWYIYQCDHQLGSNGWVTELVLRR